MANVPASGSPIKLDATNSGNTIELGTADPNVAGWIVAKFVGSGFTGTLTPVSKIGGPQGIGDTYTNAPYIRHSLAGVASDDTVVSAALTADFTIKIDASGQAVGIAFTCSGGSGMLYWKPLAAA